MDNTADPLGLGGFNSQALHPDDVSMNSGNLPSRPQHATQPAKGPSGIGGWLEKNAENIGGAIGGVAGGLIGAPLNLVGGTAADAALAAGGADLGGMLGQEVKNKLDPQQKGSVVKEGAIQGATDLIGGQLFRGGSAALKGAGHMLNNAGEHYGASQATGLTGKLAANSIETFNGMRRYGVNSIGNFKDFANKVTGSDGAISNKVNDILGRAPSVVNIARANTKFGADLQNIIDTTSTTDSEKKTAQNLLNSIDKNLGGLQGRNDLSAQNASDVFKNAQKVLEKKAESVARTGNPSSEALAAKQMYYDMSDQYQKQIDNVVGNQAVTDADKADLHKTLNAAGVTNKNLHSDIDNVNTYSDLRSIQKIPARASQIADQTDAANTKGLLSKLQSSNGVMDAGLLGGALYLHNPAIALPALATTKTAKAAGGRILPKIGSVLDYLSKPAAAISKNLTNTSASKIPASLATRIALQTGKSNVASSMSNPAAAFANSGQAGNMTGGTVSSMVNSQIQNVMNNAQQSMNQSSSAIPQLTDAEMNQILQTSGIEGLRAVEQGVDTQLAIQKQESPEITQEQQSQINDITKSLQSVSDLATLYEQARALGAGSGTLAMLGTKIPILQNSKSEAALKAYEDNRGEIAGQLATVLGTGRGSLGTLKEIENALPSPTDSEAAAQAKLSKVVSQLNQAMTSTLALPATNTPGQLTNFAGQSIPGLNLAEPNNLGLMNFIGAQ